MRKKKSNIYAMLLRNIGETVTPEDVVWHFSGVRPLFNDGASEATEATRDYVITQDRQYDDTLINVFGGKTASWQRGPSPGGSAHPEF